ncbi:MAG TPA: hypothetical protein VMW50_10365, partial [Dehalococcoidia bacterium]|nr:hypothetical protein [Dehalococcoidia bacterium]
EMSKKDDFVDEVKRMGERIEEMKETLLGIKLFTIIFLMGFFLWSLFAKLDIRISLCVGVVSSWLLTVVVAEIYEKK